MLFENITTAICFVALAAAVIYFLINCVIKKRAERIAYLRSFKRGKCVVVFLIAVPLFFVGLVYGSGEVLTSIFDSLSYIFDFVVLKISLNGVRQLMNDNVFYAVTVYFCIIVVIVNAVLLAFSVASQQLWRIFRAIKRKFTSAPQLLVFGYNSNSLNICKSGKQYFVTVLDNLSREAALGLYLQNINYYSCEDFEAVVTKTVRKMCVGKKSCTVVVNTDSDEINLEIGQLFIAAIEKFDEGKRRVLFENLRIFVFGNPQYEALYEAVVKKSCGCIRFRNKYRMIAMRFIDEYPLTLFMDERHVDYTAGLVKSDVNINVCMIGFGKTNRQIFLTSVANNQFLCRENDKLVSKQVNYYVFDKSPSEENKNLNHSINRFKNEFLGGDKNERNKDDYLSVPPLCANEKYFRLDINSPDFYADIKSIVKGNNDVNYIIISYGSDLENIDLARKLSEKRKEWGLRELAIFVKVRAPQTSLTLLESCGCHVIGSERDDVYDINEIANDKIYRMAQMRNEIYDLEYRVTHEKGFVADESAIACTRQEANRKWFMEKSQLERESSLYCCLSLRSKLNLIGFDYCGIDESKLPAITEEQFIERYASGDLPDTATLNKTVNGKKIINYTLNFPASKRRNLAELEHQRWNAFMLSKGLIPASKENILNETAIIKNELKYTNGRNYELRRHGNITTFEGLEEFRRMIASRDGVDEVVADVIKYDYQIMDDAYWLLNENGYKIIEKIK